MCWLLREIIMSTDYKRGAVNFRGAVPGQPLLREPTWILNSNLSMSCKSRWCMMRTWGQSQVLTESLTRIRIPLSCRGALNDFLSIFHAKGVWSWRGKRPKGSEIRFFHQNPADLLSQRIRERRKHQHLQQILRFRWWYAEVVFAIAWGMNKVFVAHSLASERG